MNDIRNLEVRKFLGSDDLELYPAKTLKTRKVKLGADELLFLDVGINPHMSFRYNAVEAMENDMELLKDYLD